MMKKVFKLIVAIVFLPFFGFSQGFTIDATTGNLIDANGNNFIMKGINVPLSWYQTDVNNSIAALRTNTNSNCLRIVINAGNNGTTATPTAVWQQCIQRCIDNNMIPMVELHDYTGNTSTANIQTLAQWYVTNAAYFKQPAIARYILINICNEWGEWATANTNGTSWRDGFNSAVTTIRNAGINTTLVIDAVGYGQDIDDAKNIRAYALGMLNADPLKNLLFSVHMYCEWRKGGDDIPGTLQYMRTNKIPFIVGEFGYQHATDGSCDIDEQLIMDQCQAKGIGWLAWSQKGNGSPVQYLDLCNDWNCTNLSTWGNTVINGTNGTKTSVTCTVFNTTTNPTPTVAITLPVNNAIFCSGNTITINATAAITTGSISKVDFYDGNTLLGTDNTSPYSYTWINPIVGNRTIGVIATSAANVASTKVTITVSVAQATALPTVTTPVTYCQNATATVLSATGTTLKWYTTQTGGTALASAPTPTTSVTGTTTYYVSQTQNNCEGPRASIAVSVNASPTIPTISTPISYVQNTTASALTATGTSLKWYTVASGGTPSTVAPTPSTSAIGSVNYYVSQTINSCESPRALISVVVIAPSVKISLKAGWNLIGCPLITSTPIESALSSIWSNVETVKNLEAFYSSANIPAFNSLKVLEWGKGYFVKVKVPCELDWIVR